MFREMLNSGALDKYIPAHWVLQPVFTPLPPQQLDTA